MALPKVDAFTSAGVSDLASYDAGYLNVTGKHGITSNAVYANNGAGSGENCAVWTTDTANADQKASGTIIQRGSRDMGVAVRGATGGAVTYYGYYGHGSSYGTRELFKEVSGVRTSLGTTGSQWSVNDIAYLEASGTSLNAKRNGSLDAFGAKTDAAISSGQPGIVSTGQNASSSLIDDVTFDNLAAAGPTVTAAVQAQSASASGAISTQAGLSAAVQAQSASSSGSVGVVVGITAAAQAQAATVSAALGGGIWTQLSPSYSTLPGASGTRAARGYSSLTYDHRTKRIVNNIGWIDSSPGRRDSIYSNNVEALDLAANTLTMLKLSNWTCQVGSTQHTIELPANATDPTPPNRHSYACCLDGKFWLVSGLNTYIHFDHDFAPSAVDTTAETLNIGTTSPLTHGDAVTVSSTGTLPAGLAAVTTYYVIRVDGAKVKLATTYDNAMAGTAINLTSQGTGTHTLSRVLEHPSDVWSLDLLGASASWTQYHPNPSYHAGGNAYTASLSPNHLNGKILITNLGHNGASSGGQSSFIWDTVAGTMRELTSMSTGGGTSPAVQSANSMAFDFKRNRTWMFGGGDLTNGGNELRYFDWTSETWTTVTQPATKPGARLYHAVVYNPKYDCLMVYGGQAGDSGSYRTDLWIYNIGANTWTQLSPANNPTASKFSYGAFDIANDQLVVYTTTDDVYWAYRYTDLNPNPGISSDAQAQAATTAATIAHQGSLSAAVQSDPALSSAVLTAPANLTADVQAQASTASANMSSLQGITAAVQSQDANSSASLKVPGNLTAAVQAQPATVVADITKAPTFTAAVLSQAATVFAVIGVRNLNFSGFFGAMRPGRKAGIGRR